MDHDDRDADNTPHAYDEGAPSTCRKCGNSREHPVHLCNHEVSATGYGGLSNREYECHKCGETYERDIS